MARPTIKQLQKDVSDLKLKIGILVEQRNDARGDLSSTERTLKNSIEGSRNKDQAILNMIQKNDEILVAIEAMIYSSHSEEGLITNQFHSPPPRKIKDDPTSQFLVWIKTKLKGEPNGL